MQQHPMPEFGSFSLLLAVVLSAYTLVMGAVALWKAKSSKDNEGGRLGETARRAGIGSFIALTGAAFALVWASFTNDYSVSYILHHTESRSESCLQVFGALERTGGLAAALGVAALGVWVCPSDAAQGGRAALGVCVDDSGRRAGVFFAAIELCGSALCDSAGACGEGWVWVESAAAVSRDGDSPSDALPGICGVLGAVCVCTGCADDALSRREVDCITRRWTMVTWLFLTCGIFLGAHWAGSVLGWAGFWGWDPVENASLMPWLTGTAFLHSVMMQEKRGMMKSWNVWLSSRRFC